jgi:hypothetical protein
MSHCPDCGHRLLTPEDHAFHDCAGERSCPDCGHVACTDASTCADCPDCEAEEEDG